MNNKKGLKILLIATAACLIYGISSGLRFMLLILCIPVVILLLISIILSKSEKAAVNSAETKRLSVVRTFREAIMDRSYLCIFLAFFTCGYILVKGNHRLCTDLFASEHTAPLYYGLFARM